jgi:threonine dehydrogenase-like Zn-dependent dehydrogenase
MGPSSRRERPFARAPGTERAHYALSHIRRAKIGSSHDVLVYGATGAIGSAAVQLLKTFGAAVAAVCAMPHLELVKTLGADEVIDYTAGNFTSGGPDYDVVFDAAAKSSFGRCKRRPAFRPPDADRPLHAGHRPPATGERDCVRPPARRTQGQHQNPAHRQRPARRAICLFEQIFEI